MPKTLPRRSRALLVALACASVALTARTAAADGPREGVQFEVGVAGGAHIFSSNSELGVADDPALTSPKNGPLFGLRLGVLVHPMFGIELEGVGIPTKDRKHDLSAFILGGRLNLVYNILPGEIAHGKVIPFVLAGAGFMNVASTSGSGGYDELKKDTDFEFHGGVGVKFALNELIHLRLDGRALGAPNKEKNGFSPEFEVLAGIGFTFGGDEAAAAGTSNRAGAVNGGRRPATASARTPPPGCVVGRGRGGCRPHLRRSARRSASPSSPNSLYR